MQDDTSGILFRFMLLEKLGSSIYFNLNMLIRRWWSLELFIRQSNKSKKTPWMKAVLWLQFHLIIHFYITRWDRWKPLQIQTMRKIRIWKIFQLQYASREMFKPWIETLKAKDSPLIAVPSKRKLFMFPDEISGHLFRFKQPERVNLKDISTYICSPKDFKILEQLISSNVTSKISLDEGSSLIPVAYKLSC